MDRAVTELLLRHKRHLMMIRHYHLNAPGAGKLNLRRRSDAVVAGDDHSRRELGEAMGEFLEFAALATVCDVMDTPLRVRFFLLSFKSFNSLAAERYNHPVFILTRGEEGVKGSGRSVEGYHMYDAMTEVKGYFTRFGGHAMAAGLSMKKACFFAIPPILSIFSLCVLYKKSTPSVELSISTDILLLTAFLIHRLTILW